MALQEKGSVSFNYGGISIKNLAEGAATYGDTELGDVQGALDTVVHIYKNGASLVTPITINVVKGTEGLNELLLLIQTKIPYPMTITDNGMGFKGYYKAASATTISIGDSSGGLDIETYSFTFSGNLNILSMER